jgi:predicted GNAT family acetyltransferase
MICEITFPEVEEGLYDIDHTFVDDSLRGQGIAGKLIEALVDLVRKEGRKTVVLTCKEHLIHYYSRFGFENRGVSESVHGGAVWYDMVLPL